MPLRGIKTEKFKQAKKQVSAKALNCDRCDKLLTRSMWYYETTDEVVSEMGIKRKAVCCQDCMTYLRQNPTASMGVFMD